MDHALRFEKWTLTHKEIQGSIQLSKDFKGHKLSETWLAKDSIIEQSQGWEQK